MKRNRLCIVIVTALVFAGLLSAPRARATAYAYSDLLFNNLLISPDSGTLQFTYEWDVNAYARAGGNSVLDMGTATNVLANATGPYSSAHGEAFSTPPPTNNVTASANSIVDIPDTTVAQDYARGYGSLDGMFCITGGTGTVNTAFSVLLGGSLWVSTDMYGVLARTETLFTLEIDGRTVLSDYQRLSIGPSDEQTFDISYTLSGNEALQFDKEYWIHLEVDSESLCVNVPEPSAFALLAAGLAALACLGSRRRTRSPPASAKDRRGGGSLFLLSALLFVPLAVQAKYIGGDPPHCPLCSSCQTCGGDSPKSPDCPVSEASGGSSINLTEGNLKDDYSAAIVRNAAGVTLDLTLTYNSYNADGSRAIVNTVMGLGWTHSYNVFLFEQRGSMFFMDGVGRVVKFQAGPRWVYTASPGYFETLVRNPDGTFTMTNAEMIVFQFASITNTPFTVEGTVYRLTSIVDRNQNTTTLSYSNGCLTTITDTYGRSLNLGYNGQNKLQSITDPLGRVTTLQYDAGGSQLLGITDPAGKSVQYAYNFMNQLTGKTNKDGRTFSYLYSNFMPVSIVDGAGQPLFSLGNPVNWAVNDTNLALNMMREYLPATTTKTDGRGNTWLYDYDSRGHVTQITAPDLTSTSYSYDPVTLRVASKTNANGAVTAYSYDAKGNVTNMTDALGNVTAYTYDPVFNQMTSMTDPNGYVTAWQYDEHGNRTNEVDAIGYTRSWTYDSHGNVLTEKDKNGNITHYYYDQYGNRTNTTDALGDVTTFTYNAVGDLVSRVDANGHASTYAYDALGRLIAETNGLTIEPLMAVAAGFQSAQLQTKLLQSGGIQISWDKAGWILTHSTNIAGPYEDVMAGAAPLAAGPYVISAPFTNPCEFFRLRYSSEMAAQAAESSASLESLSGTGDTGSVSGTSYQTQSSGSGGDVTTYTYDAVGNRTNVTDCNGNPTGYEFDLRNRLIKTTDALGYAVSYAYDDNNNRTAMTNQNSCVTIFEYDDNDRLVHTIDALGYVSGKTYDGVGNVVSETDARTNTTFYGYDALDRRTAITNALNYVTRFEYDAPLGGGGSCGCGSGTAGTSLITKQIDANGKVTYFKYCPLGRLLKTIRKQGDTADLIDSDDAVTSYVYDPNGNRLAVIDPNGITNSFGYDALNRQIASTNGAGEASLTAYDSVGNVLTVSAPNGNIMTNSYDVKDRLIQLDDKIGRVVSYTYDCVGNRLSATDGNNNTVSYVYDALNRLTTVTDAMGQMAHNFYDPVGNLTNVVDRMTNAAVYLYDALNRRTGMVDANGCETSYAYDGVGNLQAITDANSHTTSYEYDALNRQVRETYPDSTNDTRTFTYDGVGNVTSRTDQKGNTTFYLYSDLNFLTNRAYANDPSDRFTYDLAGRMLTASKTNWLTTNDWVVTFAYDDANRVTNTTQGGRVIAYAYNVPGRTRTLTYPSGTNITETTDFRGRLLTVNDGGATPIATYTYDLGNRVLTRTYRNGVVAEYEYNPNNWITSLIHTNPAASNLIAGFTYDYDKEGNKLYEENLWNTNRSEAYAYDSIYRLTNWLAGILVGGIIPSPTNTQAWQLDCLGNWNATITNGVTQTRTHNEANEITSIDTNNIYHDANGNLTNDGRYAYAYDDENRLVKATRLFLIPGDSGPRLVGQYAYDALGRRIEKITDPDPTNTPVAVVYLHDVSRIIEEQDTASLFLGIYTYGNYIDEVHTENRGGQTYFCQQNALSSIAAVTDNIGNPVERYAYNAYGFVIVNDGSGNPVSPNPWGTPHSAVGNTITFTGRQLDGETGLYYYRARYYDCTKGRFLQRDPIGYIDDMNVYGYVMNNPGNWIDPRGMALWTGTERVQWSMWQSVGWHFWGVHGSGWVSTGSSGVRLNVQTLECCKIKWLDPVDISDTAYRLKLSGYLFSRDHSFAANAKAEIVEKECDCKDKRGKTRKVDGLKVTIGHQYSTKETAKVKLSGKIGVEFKREGGSIGGELGGEIEFAPSKESSRIYSYLLICPTDGGDSAPIAKYLSPPHDLSVHEYHKSSEPVWNGLSRSN